MDQFQEWMKQNVGPAFTRAHGGCVNPLRPDAGSAGSADQVPLLEAKAGKKDAKKQKAKKKASGSGSGSRRSSSGSDDKKKKKKDKKDKKEKKDKMEVDDDNAEGKAKTNKKEKKDADAMDVDNTAASSNQAASSSAAANEIKEEVKDKTHLSPDVTEKPGCCKQGPEPDAMMWYYKDNSGEEFGPYPSSAMKLWWQQGRFWPIAELLEVRSADMARFCCLKDLYPEPVMERAFDGKPNVPYDQCIRGRSPKRRGGAPDDESPNKKQKQKLISQALSKQRRLDIISSRLATDDTAAAIAQKEAEEKAALSVNDAVLTRASAAGTSATAAQLMIFAETLKAQADETHKRSDTNVTSSMAASSATINATITSSAAKEQRKEHLEKFLGESNDQ